MNMDPGVPYSPQYASNHQRTFSDAPSPAPNGLSHNMPIPAAARVPPSYNGVHNAANGGGFGGQMARALENNGQISKSPPAQKQNTSHVVCKFFRVGNCQAGNACPFSHILEDTMAPCKYFAKGNCKFGAKCANVHLLPDGRDGRKVPMRGQYGSGFGYSKHFNQGNKQAVYGTGYSNQAAYQSPAPMQEEYFHTQQRQLENVPMIDAAYSGQPYGSPREDSQFALSPPVRAVDTAFPASFDDRAIPLHAREGQIAASAPKRFGFEPLSVPSATTSTITSNAFGNSSYLTAGNTQNPNRLSLLGSSPSAIEDAFPRRILHSDLRPQSGMYASSFQGPFLLAPSPPPEDSSDERSSEELTRVPGALDDLLTPREKVRRFSRPAADTDGGFRPRSLSGFGSPGANSPVGSPSNASPSSRYGALFARRQRGEDTSNELGTSASGASAFGHVGSPLRKSSLQADLLSTSNSKPSPIARTRSGNEQSLFAPSLSPITRPSGLGMLSQQLRASRLSSGLNASDDASNQDHLHPNAGGLPTLHGLGSQKLDRTISSSSMGRSVGDRIDEEEAGTDDGVFEMDDEGKEKDRKVKTSEQNSAQQPQGSGKQIDKERSAHSPQEITPNATGAGSQESQVNGSAPAKGPQPTQSRWTGGGAWNIVAAAGNKMGLTSSAKPAEAGTQGRPAGNASTGAKMK